MILSMGGRIHKSLVFINHNEQTNINSKRHLGDYETMLHADSHSCQARKKNSSAGFRIMQTMNELRQIIPTPCPTATRPWV